MDLGATRRYNLYIQKILMEIASAANFKEMDLTADSAITSTRNPLEPLNTTIKIRLKTEDFCRP